MSADAGRSIIGTVGRVTVSIPDDAGTQFRIVTGHGTLVLPVKQKARLLSLALREAEIVEDCITNQGIRLNVRAVAAFKVGGDPASIANAARRFLSEQDRMEVLVGRVFAGHLRSIIGGLTVEQIIRERDRVAQEVKDGSHAEMEKLGIVVDALEIQEIEDASGYINNLAAPHAAAVASQARIAQARADQQASEQEQLAQAMKAQYERDLAIKRAGFQAETEQANAQAYQQRTLAEAARDQAKYTADAEAYRRKVIADAAAYAERTTAQAQAEANKARAASLADGNQELIAASQIVESLPAMVTAAAQGISSSNLTILNGSEGLGEVIAGVVGQGLSTLDTLKKSAPVQAG
ncbi:MAG TPA: SPFH domain-containing protein [Streptosporangiaceae bacterium]